MAVAPIFVFCTVEVLLMVNETYNVVEMWVFFVHSFNDLLCELALTLIDKH